MVLAGLSLIYVQPALSAKSWLWCPGTFWLHTDRQQLFGLQSDSTPCQKYDYGAYTCM